MCGFPNWMGDPSSFDTNHPMSHIGSTRKISGNPDQGHLIATIARSPHPRSGGGRDHFEKLERDSWLTGYSQNRPSARRLPDLSTTPLRRDSSWPTHIVRCKAVMG